MTLLAVDRLSIEFPAREGWKRVVDDVSFTLDRGEVVGLVGESGSGKTVTSLALLGLAGQKKARVAGGSIRFDGRDLGAASEAEWQAVRGNRIAMIFQQPILALNPALTVGEQVAETIRRHRGLGRKEAWEKAVEMLARVDIPEPARRARDYPHTFSGGMAQRVMIAQALSCEPDLLIADEPTTALDVTIQARVLELLRQLQAETGMGMLLITHDLAVVSQMADRLLVMRGGAIVDQGPCLDVLTASTHPYTRALLDALPEASYAPAVH